MEAEDKDRGEDEDTEEQSEPESVLFVKNLNFDTTEESLMKVRRLDNTELYLFRCHKYHLCTCT